MRHNTNFTSVVALVLCLLAATDVTANSSRAGATRVQLGHVQERIEAYRRNHGELPASLLAILDGESGWKRRRLLVDAWGNQFIYRARKEDNMDYSLYSTGSNGLDELGAGDDIVRIKKSFLPQAIAAAIIGLFGACIVALVIRRKQLSAGAA